MMRSLITPIVLLLFVLAACTHDIYIDEDQTGKAIELNKKGSLYAQFGKYDSAMIYYDQAIALDKSFSSPHQGKRTIYIMQHAYDKALKESEWLVEKNDLDSELLMDWVLTGTLYEWQEDTKNAYKCYKRTLDFVNEQIATTSKEANRDLRMKRAFLLLLLDKEEIAAAELQSLQHDYPSDSVAISALVNFDKEAYIKQMLDAQ